ncbi:hypothetical protein IAR55_006865 [Kwoniella newhampshirensis]|uniref:C2H2-type domain-containing protein n=1 Tax=Kwoniella newhampshirensis TaxID=1651941 RepID=A0AAW0YTI2_9TREE
MSSSSYYQFQSLFETLTSPFPTQISHDRSQVGPPSNLEPEQDTPASPYIPFSHSPQRSTPSLPWSAPPTQLNFETHSSPHQQSGEGAQAEWTGIEKQCITPPQVSYTSPYDQQPRSDFRHIQPTFTPAVGYARPPMHVYPGQVEYPSTMHQLYKAPPPPPPPPVLSSTGSWPYPSSMEYAQPMERLMSSSMDHEDMWSERRGGTRNLKKHVCEICSKKFNRPSALITHTSVHTGAKPFMCQREGCGRFFSVQSNLRRHQKTHERKDSEARETQSKSPTIISPPAQGLSPSIPPSQRQSPEAHQPSPYFYDWYQSYQQPHANPIHDATPTSPEIDHATISRSDDSHRYMVSGGGSADNVASYQTSAVAVPRRAMWGTNVGMTGISADYDPLQWAATRGPIGPY